MAAPPEAPGANAVYLSFEEDDNDVMNVDTITVRLKVLTQAGVERYSDVQVGVPERHFAIENVEAQTVHQDGSVSTRTFFKRSPPPNKTKPCSSNSDRMDKTIRRHAS